ncbi:copper amine oxidase N-terminal domain-containing protein [Paenibacillus sp. BAC0078]
MPAFRKTIAVCLMLFVISQGSISAASAIRPITVNINGEFITTDSTPFIVSGRVMIPIRTLASLGLTYSWDAESHSATITNSAKDTFIMTQGQRTAYKNGQPVQMDSEANNYNGRLMVPARFVSEAFGYSVYYEGTRGILFVTSKDYKPDTAKLTSNNVQEARLAAISLPIQYSFKPNSIAESDKQLNFTYTFAANDATRYIYENKLVTTVVEIKNNTAYAVWQYSTNGIPGYDLYETLGGQQPSYMGELFDDYFDYSAGKYKALYTTSDGSVKSFTYQPENYGEIIQPIPVQ